MVVECTGCEKDAQGQVTAVLARVVPDTKSGTPGADAVKVKGTITWVGAHAPDQGGGVPATVRLFDRLFSTPQPDAGEGSFLDHLNPHSLKVVQAWVEPALRAVGADQRFQFERHGYFVTDRVDHTAAEPVFNRITGLKDSWAK
jgi:glutaminyl-tRNA synthetase